MPQLWLPGVEGPQDDFVERLHRQIERFAREHGLESVSVDVELEGGARFTLDRISPEPGYGFVTLSPHPTDDPDVPDELVVPIGSIRRIELDDAREQRRPFGFRLPAESSEG
jgi:hypothetical protein